jgi:anti-sigma factor RsiW
MEMTREELAAFADGELDAARSAEVAAAVAADPLLAEEVRAHRALRARLQAHFAPILEQPLPEGLTDALRPASDPVVSLAEARDKRRAPVPRWLWLAGPALAASLVLAVFVPRGGGDGYADDALAAALGKQLVATQGADAEPRILLSFRDQEGSYCRAYAGAEQSGIACRDVNGWRLRVTGAGAAAQTGEYRMAGNPAAHVLARAQVMAAGRALDADAERVARARGWR